MFLIESGCTKLMTAITSLTQSQVHRSLLMLPQLQPNRNHCRQQCRPMKTVLRCLSQQTVGQQLFMRSFGRLKSTQPQLHLPLNEVFIFAGYRKGRAGVIGGWVKKTLIAFQERQLHNVSKVKKFSVGIFCKFVFIFTVL